jgi:hypothetical protein
VYKTASVQIRLDYEMDEVLGYPLCISALDSICTIIMTA